MLSYTKRTINSELSKMEMEADVESDDQSEQNALKQKNFKKRKGSQSTSSASKKGKLDKNLYKQPTVEELNQLKETENLFHSNLFRLQIEEILNAVKMKPKYKKLFDTWFEKFKNHVNEIENNKDFELQDDTLFDDCGIKIPMAKLPNDCSGSFTYKTPASITTGGSYSLDTIVGPEASIDVFVEMPESIFQDVDAKNYRYMRKKAIYLAYIASNIDEELAEAKAFVGNHSNPVLKIVPSGKLSKKYVIFVHVVVQDTAFSMNKFTAEKNNVRPKWFFNKNYNKISDTNPPTPHYNSAILHDLTALKTNAQNVKLIKEYPNIRDGIVLLKIWLKQREFTNNFESFNGHVMTAYVLYLLLKKKLNTFMSSYQIVRNTWQHLANSNWCKEGITLCQDEKVKDRIIQYHKHYDCVFIDSTGFHNLASNILPNIFDWIASQAKISLECLNNTRVNGFQVLFMRKVPFNKAFDYIVCFHNVKAVENIVDAYSEDADKLSYGPQKYEQAINLISKILKQGLGNRVSYIGAMSRKTKEWNLSEEIPNDLERFYIGLQLDPDFAFNIMEKGPAANLPEAQQFKKFWGHKSELRRFKDGTICEAIVWAKESALISHKRLISQKITKYLLGEKLKLFDKLHYFFFSNQVEDILKYTRVQTVNFWHSLEESSLRVIKAFNELEKELSSLTDLPLTINGIQGCSPVFRYADVFPPESCVRLPDKKNVVARKNHLVFTEDGSVEEVPFYLPSVEVTVQLSTSGKWPDDLEALRMTKAAFHIQIAQCMRKQFKSRAHGSLRHIDIMKDGYVFRLRIAHQKEIGLVKQIKDKDGVIKYRDNEESIELEKQLFHLPRLTGALYGLHCQQPSFGSACCLAKRWLSAQLIDDSHMPDIAVELLMASMYLNSDPYRPAQAPQVAFLRFLEAFAMEHWTTDPIIVNFNNEMTREEIVEIENVFGTARESLPALFISTPYDPQTSMWTKEAPSPLILNRISMLAKEALRLMEEQLFKATGVSFEPLFNPPLTAYDCLIHLKDSLNPRRIESTGIYKEQSKDKLYLFKEHSEVKIPIVDFDPVAEYLKELRNVYSEFALFFHDTYGGCVIGVLLKPQALQEKEFKVTNTSCQMYNSNKKLVLNVSAMIEDFYILGKGLVKTIDIQSKKLNPT